MLFIENTGNNKNHFKIIFNLIHWITFNMGLSISYSKFIYKIYISLFKQKYM